MFDLLDEIPSLEKKMNDLKLRRAERVLNAHKLEYCLIEFIENFFLQLFGNGYGIKIDGVNTSSFDLIKKKMDTNTNKKMIDIFERAITSKRKLQIAVYSSPPRRAILMEAYRNFIPEILLTFKEDGKQMQGYDQLVERIDKVLQTIENSQT